jgi:hypothetical protein
VLSLNRSDAGSSTERSRRKRIQQSAVDAVLVEFRAAPISESLKATLAFLEILTQRPMELTTEDARAVLHAGASTEALMDAIAVGA